VPILEKMALFVYNYNLLSTKLCDPSWHYNCKEESLTTTSRWKLLRLRLEAQVILNSICCFQELSEEWISLLTPFFFSHGYTFIYDSVFLGVGISFPTKVYNLQSMNIVCIGAMLKKECKVKYSPPSQWMLIRFFTLIKSCFTKVSTEVEDPWFTAVKKQNRYVNLTLQQEESKRSFNIFTYHMPCAFRTPALMNIQSTTLLHTIQKASPDLPYILAGDFNSTPDSDVYNIITTGFLPYFPRSTTYSKTLKFCEIKPSISAYKEVNGAEPDYTNYSHTKTMPLPFRNTTDYIYSRGFIPRTVLKLRDDIPTSTFPNTEEPSDHLPLGASFDFAD
jgi:2',5'-phosphodiesterase